MISGRRIKEYVQNFVYPPGVTPLPLGISLVIFVTLLFNAMTTTMVFAYLPELVKSFGVSEVNTGTYAGYIASSMFVSQTIFNYFWGYFGDKKGKKLALICSCAGAAATTLLFGFSRNFYWAMIARFLQGAFGVMVTAKVMLLDVCDSTNQPAAMAVVLSSYTVGLLLGPSIGGYLAFPANLYPSLFSKDSVFERNTILLPNLVLCIGFVITSLVSYFVVQSDERVPTQQKCEVKKPLITTYGSISDNNENISVDLKVTRKKEYIIVALIRNKKCMISCFMFTLFQIVAIGFNELYPVWAATTTSLNGLNMNAADVAQTFMIPAVILTFVQPIVLVRIADWFGIQKVFIINLLMQAILYPLYPTLSVVSNSTVRLVLLCAGNFVTRIAVGACFMAASVMINESVTPDVIGSANGLSIAMGNVAKSATPIMFGKMFSWSLTNIKAPENEIALGYPFNQYFSFLFMSVFCISAAFLLQCVGKKR